MQKDRTEPDGFLMWRDVWPEQYIVLQGICENNKLKWLFSFVMRLD